MTTATTTNLTQAISTALIEARKGRHQPDCQCMAFGLYCSPADKIWSGRIDRLLDKIKIKETQ